MSESIVYDVVGHEHCQRHDGNLKPITYYIHRRSKNPTNYNGNMKHEKRDPKAGTKGIFCYPCDAFPV